MTILAPPAEGLTVEIPVNRAIRDAIADGLCDPREIAQRVIADLDGDAVLEALRHALPSYVRGVIRHDQRSNPRIAPGTSRWERFREDLEAYQRLECIDGVWRKLGECTPAEVKRAADYRFGVARENEKAGERLGRLAYEAEKRDASVIRDVPHDVVMEILYA